MKYGFMSFSCPTASLKQLCELAKANGYDGIELRLEAKHAHGIEVGVSDAEIAAARQLCAAEGVEICCLATSACLANPATAEAAFESAFQTAKLATQLGVPCVRVFGGAFPQELGREAAMNQLCNALTRLSDEMQKSGVSAAICMETHDSWCLPAHVAEVMRRVNRPNIRVNWDIMHPALREKCEMRDAFDQLASYISHVHIHDGVLEEGGKLIFKPIGQGGVNHEAAMACLLEAGYAGYLSGEWIGLSGQEHLAEDRDALRAIEQKLTKGA